MSGKSPGSPDALRYPADDVAGLQGQAFAGRRRAVESAFGEDPDGVEQAAVTQRSAGPDRQRGDIGKQHAMWLPAGCQSKPVSRV
jgi:hypothetical protein